MPVVGFGTYKVGVTPASASSAVASGALAQVSTTEDVVHAALDVGYRFLDCAQFYGNEAAVGRAIRSSGVPRAELFLASKVWTATIHAGPKAVQAQLENTLRDLGTAYLDLYLVHWPVPGKHAAAYQQLENAQASPPYGMYLRRGACTTLLAG